MRSTNIALCVALGATLAAAAPLLAGQNQPAGGHATHRAASHAGAARGQDAEEEGQRVFQQNCARCHNAPDGFSPRITGMIVMHMRVRANLSRHDEQMLLRFFNP